MNETEKKYYNELRRKGYEVLYKGWPDFMVIPPPEEGRPFAVELKYGKDKVRPEQKRMHKMLKRAGVDVRVHQVIPDIKKPAARQKVKTVAATRKKISKSARKKKPSWIDVITHVLDLEGKRMSTGEVEAAIKSRYSRRLKGIANPHGSIGSALARLRTGASPRVHSKLRNDGTYIYWTVGKPAKD